MKPISRREVLQLAAWSATVAFFLRQLTGGLARAAAPLFQPGDPTRNALFEFLKV